MTNITLALIYLEQVSLCYNYSFIYDFLIIHPETSTGVSEKCLFELFWVPSISIPNSCNENFTKLPQNHSFWCHWFKYIGRHSRYGKTFALERFMFVLEVQMKVCLRNFKHVQRCAHTIACFMLHVAKPELFILSFWIRKTWVAQSKLKNI